MGSIPFLVVSSAKRATEKSLAKPSCADAGGLTGRDGRKVGGFMHLMHERILHRGFGRSSPLNLALVGSLHLVTGAAGATSSGVRAKNPAAKSSTMKGAKALGSKLLMETVPNREKPSLAGKGTLLVSCPRNRWLRPAETVACREAGSWSDGVEVGPPSYVTSGVKSSLIREGALLPPVVRRCLRGEQVFQMQGTGRVVQVGAAPLEREVQANLLQGSGKVVPLRGCHRTLSGCGRALRGWHRARKDDERADG